MIQARLELTASSSPNSLVGASRHRLWLLEKCTWIRHRIPASFKWALQDDNAADLNLYDSGKQGFGARMKSKKPKRQEVAVDGTGPVSLSGRTGGSPQGLTLRHRRGRTSKSADTHMLTRIFAALVSILRLVVRFDWPTASDPRLPASSTGLTI